MHVEDPTVLDAFVVVSATLKEATIEVLSPSSLPDGWRAYPALPFLKEIVDAWLSKGRSLILKISSVTVRGQHNYLINPAHPDFASIEVSEPEPLDLDPRIIAR